MNQPGFSGFGPQRQHVGGNEEGRRGDDAGQPDAGVVDGPDQASAGQGFPGLFKCFQLAGRAWQIVRQKLPAGRRHKGFRRHRRSASRTMRPRGSTSSLVLTTAGRPSPGSMRSAPATGGLSRRPSVPRSALAARWRGRRPAWPTPAAVRPMAAACRRRHAGQQPPSPRRGDSRRAAGGKQHAAAHPPLRACAASGPPTARHWRGFRPAPTSSRPGGLPRYAALSSGHVFCQNRLVQKSTHEGAKMDRMTLPSGGPAPHRPHGLVPARSNGAAARRAQPAGWLQE